MLKIHRTDSDNLSFIGLVKQLDADLAIRDGKDHSFYAQYNGIDAIRHVVIAFENDEPVACGAIKEYEEDIMEIKRMYTSPQHRGKNIGSMVLAELEKWASELGVLKCILETGKKQPEAIALYKKNGYSICENYGQYAGIDNSVCFEKIL